MKGLRDKIRRDGKGFRLVSCLLLSLRPTPFRPIASFLLLYFYIPALLALFYSLSIYFPPNRCDFTPIPFLSDPVVLAPYPPFSLLVCTFATQSGGA